MFEFRFKNPLDHARQIEITFSTESHSYEDIVKDFEHFLNTCGLSNKAVPTSSGVSMADIDPQTLHEDY